ncbi:hypothetical protein ABW06_11550 [Pluralibacter gergoviae]|uniref:Uncharacterized protein n=1 Tax=Pluralibacter gergoviae TaxID=61647 RepID=A0A0J5L4D9_PLUGE|nr:hypothetical protein ABW07_12365 [Pluralibacter gergoviae]KMK13660.1 hypothetical protein ABW06_11550 [Pluralibacter gergoviae]KMK24864.1 hypothetical protein ABW10_09275 [Pluralibacter gergoviae]OHY63242.1 hypothetical protein BB778_22730 [Pluralibacter gergoviae]
MNGELPLIKGGNCIGIFTRRSDGYIIGINPRIVGSSSDAISSRCIYASTIQTYGPGIKSKGSPGIVTAGFNIHIIGNDGG